MKRFSPAKLNLFLHITGRRTDGYHNLQSVFCPIGFGDELHFELVAHSTAQDKFLTLTGADALTQNLDDNLIAKAVYALAHAHPTKARPIAIHLTKRLPTGAGLGGGSSNCATTLLALNELWQLGLSCDELIDIGARLGADVPFFIFADFYKTSAIVEGIGERLSPIALPACEFLLLLPNAHINTAQFFAKDTLKRNCPSYDHHTLSTLDFYRLPADFGNVFEPLAVEFSPNIGTALGYLHSLERHTHTTARMTGTGSVVFLPLINVSDADKANFVKNAPCPALIAPLLV